MPDDYVDWLTAYYPAEGSGENPIGDNAVANARAGKAIGVAIANDFCITVHSKVPSDSELLTLARAFQIDPHAIAAPEWSSKTGCEGAWTACNEVRHVRAERAIRNGMTALAHGILDVSGEYGMWIHAGVHDKWLPHGGDPAEWGVPQLHRVWQASHYRNVWANWLLYLRSGSPELRMWARATSDHFLHVATVHYADPSVRGGRHVGDMSHCYAPTPWGGQADSHGHFIDPDAYRLRGLLMCDPYALEMYNSWFSALAKLDPTLADREAVNTLGAVVAYYIFTRSPDALLLLYRHAADVFGAYWNQGSGKFEFGATASPATYPVWHRQCYSLYHALTKDPRAVQLVIDWIAAGYGGINQLTPRAFAYSASGNVAFLADILADVHAHSLLYHDAPGDRYHGYGPAIANNDASYFFQELPFFLHALESAGMELGSDATSGIAYPSALRTPGIRVTAYAFVPAAANELQIHFKATAHTSQPVAPGTCEISRLEAATWVPTQTVQYGQDPAPFEIVVLNGGLDNVYRIIVRSEESQFLAPFTSYPEVIEIKKLFFDGTVWQNGVRSWGIQSFWADWKVADVSSLLLVEGETSGAYYVQPAYFACHSAAGEVTSGRTIFGIAQDDSRSPLPAFRSFDVELGTARPWHIYSASVVGPMLSLKDGPDRIFLALQREHLQEVLPRIP